jgi:hypothetical protein
MTNGERSIRDAIDAFKDAIEAGDEADEVMAVNAHEHGTDNPWIATEAGLQKCLAVLTSKPAEDLAAETWGAPSNAVSN